jgi:hypothetical protein
VRPEPRMNDAMVRSISGAAQLGIMQTGITHLWLRWVSATP